MKRIFNGLIFALISLPALAQDQEPERWYEVEIILFEQLNPVSTGSELWPLDIEQPDLSNSIDLLRSSEDAQTTDELEEASIENTAVIEPVQPIAAEIPAVETDQDKDPYLDTPFLILPAEQYQLTDAYQKLVDSENYLPLVHVAWRQIISPREQPDRIFIHDKLNQPVEDESLEGVPVIEPEAEFAPPGLDFTNGLITETGIIEPSTPEHNLSGIISLGLGRYIHVEADLLFYKPQLDNGVEDELAPPDMTQPEPMPFIFDGLEIEPTAEAEEEPAPELFRIQGNLRMPSKEVHYLDHPLVGMMILFTPYEVPLDELDELDEELDRLIEEASTPAESTNKGAIVRPGREAEDRSF